METFLKKLDRLLRAEFRGAATRLERWESPRSAGGFVVWDGFMGMDPRQRVKRVYDALRDRLTASEVQRLAMFMPVTPLELKLRVQRMEEEEAEIQQSGAKTS